MGTSRCRCPGKRGAQLAPGTSSCTGHIPGPDIPSAVAGAPRRSGSLRNQAGVGVGVCAVPAGGSETGLGRLQARLVKGRDLGQLCALPCGGKSLLLRENSAKSSRPPTDEAHRWVVCATQTLLTATSTKCLLRSNTQHWTRLATLTLSQACPRTPSTSLPGSARLLPDTALFLRDAELRVSKYRKPVLTVTPPPSSRVQKESPTVDSRQPGVVLAQL